MNEVKKNHFTIDSPNLKEALNPIREKILSCIQCGTCSGSCPNLFAMDYTPRQLWRLVIIGDIDTIFNSQTFRLCSSCYYCTLRCPRKLPLTDAMAQLKQIASQQRISDRKTTHFYNSFLESVQRHGRVREMEFMMLYLWALKDPLLSLTFLPLGWKLMRRGKIVFQVPVKGSSRLAPLFRKVAQLEGRA